MRHPLKAQFVLDLHGQPSNDLYTVCGKCAGSVGGPSKNTWRCGDGVKVRMGGRAVTVFNLYKYCSFEWKWRNLNQTEDGGYEPPNNGEDFNDNDNERVVNIADGVCSEGKIHTVYTKWGEMVTDPGTRMNHGKCSSIIIPELKSEALAKKPTDQTANIRSGTLSENNRRSAIANTTAASKLFQGKIFILYLQPPVQEQVTCAQDRAASGITCISNAAFDINTNFLNAEDGH